MTQPQAYALIAAILCTMCLFTGLMNESDLKRCEDSGHSRGECLATLNP